jgi:Cellulase (glycosyl hydrolase family 5)
MLTALAAAVALMPRYLREEQPAARTVCGSDQLQAHAVAGLANFADWLRDNAAAGFVGEVGWPSGRDGPLWDALAETWYQAADALGLPVTAWAAAGWPSSYPMAVYSRGAGSGTLDTAGPQAAVVQAHPGTKRYLRGVVLAGGSFGTAADSFSSTNPGRYGQQYSYENADSYAYLAAHGVRLVRLAVAWERLQPVPAGPLDAAELGRLRQALDFAARAHLRVLVDLHSYGEFMLGTAQGPRPLVLGSPELPAADLADLWSRLATALAGSPAVYGYDVMNEPTTLAVHGASGARLWEQASQDAVTAIRATGSTAMIAVTGYGQTSPAHWGELHPRTWIDDPLGRVLYSAHVYFDADSSGHYDAGYAEELARVAPDSAPLCTTLATLKGPA